MSNSIQEICFAYIIDIGQVAGHAKRNNENVLLLLKEIMIQQMLLLYS